METGGISKRLQSSMTCRQEKFSSSVCGRHSSRLISSPTQKSSIASQPISRIQISFLTTERGKLPPSNWQCHQAFRCSIRKFCQTGTILCWVMIYVAKGVSNGIVSHNCIKALLKSIVISIFHHAFHRIHEWSTRVLNLIL